MFLIVSWALGLQASKMVIQSLECVQGWLFAVEIQQWKEGFFQPRALEMIDTDVEALTDTALEVEDMVLEVLDESSQAAETCLNTHKEETHLGDVDE